MRLWTHFGESTVLRDRRPGLGTGAGCPRSRTPPPWERASWQHPEGAPRHLTGEGEAMTFLKCCGPFLEVERSTRLSFIFLSRKGPIDSRSTFLTLTLLTLAVLQATLRPRLVTGLFGHGPLPPRYPTGLQGSQSCLSPQ